MLSIPIQTLRIATSNKSRDPYRAIGRYITYRASSNGSSKKRRFGIRHKNCELDARMACHRWLAESRELSATPGWARTPAAPVIEWPGMLAARIISRILVAAFFLLCIDGFLHRDPTVDLGNGYEIVAVSADSPCVLNYRPWIDKREYSGWHAIAGNAADERDGTDSSPFLLTHDEQEWLQFDDAENWRRAWREKRATFGPNEVGHVEGISAFRNNGRCVIGVYGDGYFVLDMMLNRVDTFRDRAKWRAVVQTATNLTGDDLRDPKSWLVQSRELILCLTPVRKFGIR